MCYYQVVLLTGSHVIILKLKFITSFTALFKLQTSRWPPVWETAVNLAVAGGVFDGVFLCCSFFPLDVLDEIRGVIEPVSEGFLTYSYMK